MENNTTSSSIQAHRLVSSNGLFTNCSANQAARQHVNTMTVCSKDMKQRAVGKNAWFTTEMCKKKKKNLTFQ